MNKPPLGIMPETIHSHQRVLALVRAIDRYTEAENYSACVASWCEELLRRVTEEVRGD